MKQMSRKKKLLLNAGAGIIKQVVAVICGFILPRYMILYFGSATNGLIASIDHFLSFIALLDMGVGAVVQSNLYGPLARKDSKQISKIIKSSERFFRTLACIFVGYIIVLCFLYPMLIDTTFDKWFTISLIIIIAISTLAQFLFGITYQLLLNADQKAYIQLFLQIGTILINTIAAILLMKAGATIHIVKLMTAMVYTLRPLGQMLYVRKHYKIEKRIVLNEEPIKQKWNGFSQHLAAVVCQNIDVAALSIFSTLKNVSVYSVYFNVINGVEQIIMTAASGLESLFGNMIAKGEKEILLKTFSVIEWVVHTSVTIIFSITAITIVPFIQVYTRGVDDTNYIVPLFSMFLVMAYAFQCLRIPYFRIIKAAGHFKETQNGAFISALLNITITLALVFRFGLVGAAFGTLVAMLYHTCYFVWYLRRNILERSPKYFISYLISDSITAVISYMLTKGTITDCPTYMAWIVLALRVSIIVVIISATINLIVYRSQIKGIRNILFKKE